MAATGMSNADRSRATREALLLTARDLFAQRGYAAVGTEEIVRAAGVTRGALYHHFAGKKELFEAVYEEVERELVDEIALSAGSAATDAFQALHAGTRAFLQACEDPAIQRIALLDAASVLGWERWREVGMKYGMGLVQTVLGEAMEAGLIERQPAEPLAAVLLGAVDEGAMVIARADDGGATRAAVEATLARFIDSLARRPSPE
jgi:AcrR family transcriptional regulator